MAEKIFSEHAPAYWAKGLPAIPLRQGDKMPVGDLHGWQYYAERMPTPAEQDVWLRSYPYSNIGLVLGPQSGLCMLDIDTSDETIKKTILDVLRPTMSPWQRVGAKGMVLAYKQPFDGTPIKTFRIKHAQKQGDESQTIVELLSTRTQVVLPPSIHPTTKRPYVANADLLDLLDDLPHVPRELENLLRQALIASGLELSHSGWTRVTDFVSLGSRDNQMIRVAGFYAAGVSRGELTLLEAIQRMGVWHETCVEKVASDDLDINKGISSVVGFLTRDVLERNKVLPKNWDEGLDDETKKKYGLDFTEEHEEWSFQQLMNYMTAEFPKHTRGSQQFIEVVNYVLERIARSASLGGIEIGTLLKYIWESSGKQITIGALNHRLKEMTQGEIKGMDHTEIAQAVLGEINTYGEVRFHNQKLWQWAGSNWERREEEEVLRVIAEKFGSMPAAKRRSDHSGILKVMQSLCGQALKTDSRPGINFANGYLTEDLRLLPHDPSFGCTYTMPYRYIPGKANEAKRFQAFLDRSWTGTDAGPDEDIAEKKMALQELMAATLFGVGTRYARVALLFGLAATGKTQILNLIDGLLPSGVRSALKPETWALTFSPAQLDGKLLNIAGELSEKNKIDGDIFKQIVDGSVITAQEKGKPLFEFRPSAMHWFASNHLPKSNDTSAGFNRRWLILGFEHPVKKEERVADLANQLIAEEREQIVAWAVEGITRLLKNNDYTLPPSHERWIKDVAQMNDSVRFWIESSAGISIDPFGQAAKAAGSKNGSHTSETQLYDHYSGFCIGQGGARPVILKTFQTRMRELGAEKGFKKVMKPLGNGAEEAAYENVIAVVARGR
jgi:P4 family phage/plasmid primase-like protien